MRYFQIITDEYISFGQNMIHKFQFWRERLKLSRYPVKSCNFWAARRCQIDWATGDFESHTWFISVSTTCQKLFNVSFIQKVRSYQISVVMSTDRCQTSLNRSIFEFKLAALHNSQFFFESFKFNSELQSLKYVFLS